MSRVGAAAVEVARGAVARIAAVAGRLVLIVGAGRVVRRRGRLGGFRAAKLARAVLRRREAESLGHVRAGVDRAAAQLAPVQQVQRLQGAHERQCSQTESRRARGAVRTCSASNTLV